MLKAPMISIAVHYIENMQNEAIFKANLKIMSEMLSSGLLQKDSIDQLFETFINVLANNMNGIKDLEDSLLVSIGSLIFDFFKSSYTIKPEQGKIYSL